MQYLSCEGKKKEEKKRRKKVSRAQKKEKKKIIQKAQVYWKQQQKAERSNTHDGKVWTQPIHSVVDHSWNSCMPCIVHWCHVFIIIKVCNRGSILNTTKGCSLWCCCHFTITHPKNQITCAMAANRVENLENQKKKKKRKNGVSASGVGCFEELRFEEKRRRKKKRSRTHL